MPPLQVGLSKTAHYCDCLEPCPHGLSPAFVPHVLLCASPPGWFLKPTEGHPAASHPPLAAALPATAQPGQVGVLCTSCHTLCGLFPASVLKKAFFSAIYILVKFLFRAVHSPSSCFSPNFHFPCLQCPQWDKEQLGGPSYPNCLPSLQSELLGVRGLRTLFRLLPSTFLWKVGSQNRSCCLSSHQRVA
jgi:hypothetical protein